MYLGGFESPVDLTKRIVILWLGCVQAHIYAGMARCRIVVDPAKLRSATDLHAWEKS
jgi:hypothetical protein